MLARTERTEQHCRRLLRMSMFEQLKEDHHPLSSHAVVVTVVFVAWLRRRLLLIAAATWFRLTLQLRSVALCRVVYETAIKARTRRFVFLGNLLNCTGTPNSTMF